MPTEKTITLYTYEELSERAKEAARSWWSECRDSVDYESVLEDFAEIVKFMGFDLRTHGQRDEPNIWWQLGYVQSDFAGFEARYGHVNHGFAALKAYAPKDETLHAIAATLQDMQRRNFYKITADIKFDDRRGYEITTLKDGQYMFGSDAEIDAERTIREACKDLSQWLYARLREQDDYLNSEEAIAEAMAANEYTFREDGKRED